MQRAAPFSKVNMHRTEYMIRRLQPLLALEFGRSNLLQPKQFARSADPLPGRDQRDKSYNWKLD
jgi:hypothetical protein